MNLNLNRARLLLSETDQTEQREVRIQIKRSAIQWTCKDEDVLAVQRFIELVKYLSKFLQKGFRNVRANAPPDTQDC